MGMIPNIKQRKDAVNRGKSHRRKAAGMFSDSEYRKRALIEGIFGARPGGTSCTAGLFGRTTGAGSPREGDRLEHPGPHRFECANRLNISIPSYGGMAHVGCA